MADDALYSSGMCSNKCKVMGHETHGVALISVSWALSQMPVLHCQVTMDTGLVHHAVCLFTSQLSLDCTYPQMD